MKTFFHVFAAVCAASAMMFTSCSKTENPDNGDNGDNGGNGGGTDTELSEVLTKGSDFYLISIGDEENEYLAGKKKITMDLRPYTFDVDGDGQVEEGEDGIGMYIWENTYLGGTPSGVNSFGFGEGWLSLVVADKNWSGAAYNLTESGVTNRKDLDLLKELDKDGYYFHLAYRTMQENIAHLISINWCGKSYKFAIGEGSFDESDSNGNFVKKHSVIAPVNGAFKIGEWAEYEIKVADMGIDWTVEAQSDNFFQMSSGGVAGTTLDLDAIFFYKKN